MSFGDAVRSVLQQNYATFAGRARRSEYWFWALALFVGYIICLVATLVVKPLGIILFLVLILGAIVPTISVTVRRLHDTGRSGAWYFIGLVPFIGGIWLLVLTVLDSQGDNQYGPSPKAGGMAPYPPAGYQS